MEETTHGWTVVHSLHSILVTFLTSHAERSPLNFPQKKTLMMEDIEREEEEEERRV